MVESMKKKYDLVTYRDIVAYSRGEEPVRDKRGLRTQAPGSFSRPENGG